MIRLDSTTRKLQVVLAGAVTTNQLPVVVSYSDQTSSTYNGATQLAVTNNTTEVDICSAPPAATTRDVDFIQVQNTDTVPATVTVRVDAGGTNYDLKKVTLAAGESLTYTHGAGWSTTNAGGGTGDVVGPASATDNAIALFDTTTGKLIQNSVITVDDGGNFAGVASINGGPLAGLRNVAINGGFTINQRAYASAAALASGAYGHDRWKAGAGGGNYSFTQLASNTLITIAANKTLIQVVEYKNVQATRYVVSWTGTALGRVGVNSATPSGAYAASPIVISGQTAGTTMSVEFGNGASSGTLGDVMIVAASAGTVDTPFEQRPYGMELALCQRYYYRITADDTAYVFGIAYADSATSGFSCGQFPVTLRTSPTALEQNGTAANYNIRTGGTDRACSSVVAHNSNSTKESWYVTTTVASGQTAGQAGVLNTTTIGAYLGWSAEL